MAQADLTWLTYFLPIIAFLIVFLAIYIVLKKTDFIDNQFLILLFAFLVSSVFVSAAGSIGFISNVLPWFAVLAVSLVFILALTGFVGKDAEFMHKGIGVAVVIILGLVFLISAFVFFSNLVVGYLPGPFFGEGLSLNETKFLSWAYSPRIMGAVLLIVTSAIVSWILVKAK